MSGDHDDEVRLITALWLDRFGEPPPILTDAELMWDVLRNAPASSPEDRPQ